MIHVQNKHRMKSFVSSRNKFRLKNCQNRCPHVINIYSKFPNSWQQILFDFFLLIISGYLHIGVDEVYILNIYRDIQMTCMIPLYNMRIYIN